MRQGLSNLKFKQNNLKQGLLLWHFLTKFELKWGSLLNSDIQETMSKTNVILSLTVLKLKQSKFDLLWCHMFK